MVAAPSDKQPLLKSPVLGSSLNPTAAPFTFQPRTSPRPSSATLPPTPFSKRATPPAPTPKALAPEPPAPQATSTVPASASALSVNTTPTISASPVPTTNGHHNEAAPHITIPTTSNGLTPAAPRPESVHSSGASSFSSDFSSILPSRTAFRRAHQLQFFLSGLVVLVFFVGLAYWHHEIRWFDLTIGACGFLACESLKEPIFEALTHEVEVVGQDDEEEGGAERPLVHGIGMGRATTVHAIAQEFIRLGGIVLVVALLPEPISTSFGGMPKPPRHAPGPREPRAPLPPLDTLFFSALWFALGWALVEIVWGSRDLYKRIQLYDDVLEDSNDDLESEDEDESAPIASSSAPATRYGTMESSVMSNGNHSNAQDSSKDAQFLSSSAFDRIATDPVVREREQAQLDARIRAVEREEVEGQLGVPLFELPVAVVIVWRLDAILLSLVLTLVVSLPFRTSAPSLVAFPLWPTFAAVTATHVFLSLLWVLRIKHVGIPSVSYATLIILLFLLFAALAAWGALE